MPVTPPRLALPINLPPRLTRHITLLRTFAVLSALIMAVIGALLAGTLQNAATASALQQETAVATGQAETLLHGGEFIKGSTSRIPASARRYLAYYAHESMRYGLYVRVKIWRSDGTILFSDDPALINRRLPIDDDLAEVLSGERPSAADISDLSSEENRSERGRFKRLLEVYVPIRSGGRIVGAYELYQDLKALDGQTTSLRHRIWLSIGAGFLVLYLSLFLIVRNASHRLVRQRRDLEYQALHDALTDLPNRALLDNRLRQTLRLTRRHSDTGAPDTSALLLMDLDHFKEINDTFGHQHGDALLREVGQRLQRALRGSDIVARLGGDEFAVLLPGANRQGAEEAAERALRALEQPFELEGHTVAVGASIGIVLAPDHGDEAATLLRRADVAMYVAKREVGGYALYSPDADTYSPARLALLADLRAAIEQDQLVLHYQPKVSLRTRQLNSVEALVRWQHPRHGLIPPDQFIPLAEQSGLIAPLSYWVLEDALRQRRAWDEAGLCIDVAVNLSARLLHDERLAESIAGLLHSWEVDPSALLIEITESAVMIDPARALEMLARLHTMGLRIAIDDFGTGQSSLAYLKRLPVDELKIDKSFVLELPRHAEDVAIARSIIDLGHNLGLSVVAEGVESAEGWEQLAAMGCDLAQGYYLSRPLPAADLTRWAERLSLEERKAS